MAKRIITAVLLILSTAFLGLFYTYERQRLITSAHAELMHIAQKKRNSIFQYFEHHQKNIEQLAAQPIVAHGFEQLSKKNLKAHERNNIIKNLRNFFLHASQAKEYDHLFLLTHEAQELFSLTDELKPKASQLRISGKDTVEMSRERVVMTLAPDNYFTSYYEPTQRSALFITLPFIIKKKLAGLISVRFDDSAIFALVADYTGLGKTGEFVLGKREGNDLVYVNKVRHKLHQNNSHDAQADQVQGRKVPFGQWSRVLGEAIKGNTEFLGITLDYRGKEVIGVGTYLPEIDFGMVTKKDLDEILKPINLYGKLFKLLLCGSIISCLALLLLFLLNLGLFDAINLRLLLGFCVSLILIGYTIYYYRAIATKVILKTEIDARSQLKNIRFQLDQDLKQLTRVAQAIASIAGQISEEDLTIRLKRDLQQNPEFIGIIRAYEPEATDKLKLHAPFMYRTKKGIETIPLEQKYNYTLKNPKEPSQTAWYIQTMQKQQPTWTDIYRDPVSGKKATVYAVPFMHKNRKGVIAVLYSLEHIQNMVKELTIGKGSYSVLYNRDHTLLFYPVTELIGTSVDAIVEKSVTKEMATLLKHQKQTPSGEYTYYSPQEKVQAWLLYEPVMQTGWTLALLYNEDDMVLPSKQLFNYKMAILLFIILACIFLAFIFLYSLSYPLYMISLVVSVILGLGLGALWILIDRTLEASPNQSTNISDSVSLNEFIKTVNQENLMMHHNIPETLRTGLYVDYLQVTKNYNMLIVGRVWQKRALSQKDIKAGIKFPQALSSTIKEIYRKTEQETELVAWNVKCELYQNLDYRKYPFDLNHLNVQLEYPDVTKNVILIPDLQYYPTLIPQLLPGVGPSVQLSGFTLIQTFFNYAFTDKKQVSISSKTKISQPMLTFNIMFRRGLINTLIMYLLPLFIILISVFATLWMIEGLEESERAKSTVRFRFLNIFTAIFFSLILLHRNLRSEFQSGEIGYIDYFFFLTYFTILAMELYIIMSSKAITVQIAGVRSSIVQLLYWPVEFILMIGITVVIFFNY